MGKWFYEPGKKNAKKSLLVELDDQVLFMPTYISKQFENKEEKIDEINDGEIKYMYFGGKSGL